MKGKCIECSKIKKVVTTAFGKNYCEGCFLKICGHVRIGENAILKLELLKREIEALKKK